MLTYSYGRPRCSQTIDFRQIFQSPQSSLGWRQNQNLSVELDKSKKQLIIKDAKK